MQRRAALDEDLLTAARVVMRMSLRAADAIGGVSVVQLRALTVLRDAGSANLAQLADGMGVTVSTTSRLVDRLVSAGLVDRRTAEHTRREIALTLTPLGAETLTRYDDLRLTELREWVERLDGEDRALVERALTVLAAVPPPGADGPGG